MLPRLSSAHDGRGSKASCANCLITLAAAYADGVRASPARLKWSGKLCRRWLSRVAWSRSLPLHGPRPTSRRSRSLTAEGGGENVFDRVGRDELDRLAGLGRELGQLCLVLAREDDALQAR